MVYSLLFYGSKNNFYIFLVIVGKKVLFYLKNNNNKKDLFSFFLRDWMVSFADFKKIELKVARIEKVEDIIGKDKLYKLEIDAGEEKPRILVAGLKPFYSKEELKGKQIVIVANLDPKPLAGIFSQGMLLAVQNEKDAYSVITVEEKVKAGTVVE